MVVAFFSEGPIAAMAALLARTGLVALGTPPAELAFEDGRAGRRPETVPVDSVLAFVAMHRQHDVLLALPLRLLSDAAVRAAVDVAVSVGPTGGDVVLPGRPTAWHLGCNDDPCVRRGRTPALPVRLPDIHHTASTFVRDGVACAPPVRDALKLIAVLQALAADPGTSDVEACVREFLLADVPDGVDIAVDRLRAIADRLDTMPGRTSGPVGRRTASGNRRGGPARRQAAFNFDVSRTAPGAACRSVGRRR